MGPPCPDFLSGAASGSRHFLLLSQAYVPDAAAVGQYAHEAARALVERGHRVTVFTADRGHSDPQTRYPRRELLEGVEVRRFAFSSLGKASFVLRELAAASFGLQCALAGCVMRRLDGLIVTSLPPTNPVAALIIRAVRRVPLHYWALDINPDQAIAMGVVRATSPAARGLELVNRKVLQRASSVITLDEAMAARLRRKADLDGRLYVIPPWCLRQHEEAIPHEQNPFRRRLDLRGSRVVCYSGNHTPHSPLETILQAAVRLRDNPSLAFMFIGEGPEKRRIEDLVSAHALKNARSLPYLPLDETPRSLSAADIHLVVVGEREVGLRHPCKFYSALALGRPVLLVGPDESPFVEILRREGVGWHVRHGEVDAAVAILIHIAGMPAAELAAMGELTRAVSRRCFPRNALLERFCRTIEDATAISPSVRSSGVDTTQASGAAAEGSSWSAPGPRASKHEPARGRR